MLDQRSYSIAELERATGFDRRTIVYYMQSGLVPRPGRRGPKTRYPGEAMVRLRFLRGVKDLQERGELLNFTLADVRQALEQTGIARIAELVEQQMPVSDIAPLLTAPVASPERTPESAAPPVVAAPAADPVAGTPEPARAPAAPFRERRAFGLADANVRQRFAPAPSALGTAAPADGALPPTTGEPMPPTGAPLATSPVPDLAELSRLLRELELRPAMSGRRLAPGAAEQWTEIPITSRIYLSVRGLGAEDAALADSVARALKRVLRA